jgi:hypothetical protein
MVEHLDKLPQTGWGVIALVAGGLLLLIGMMVRGLLTQRQINSAVNHRQIGEPTLVAMVSEIHANHRQLSSDVRYIRSEVNGLQQWRAGYDGSELATGVGVANFLHEMRDGMNECKREMRETQKMVTTYGCPVRLQQEQACLKHQP